MPKVYAKNGKMRGYRGLVLKGVSTVRPFMDLHMDRAYLAGLKCGGGLYWPWLGALNTAERRLVRQRVADRITYECSTCFLESAFAKALRDR